MGSMEISEKILTLQLDWISASDRKIVPIFAINAAMLGVIAALLPLSKVWEINTAIVTLLSVIPLIGSTISLALATFPRLNGPKGSLIFFSGIVTRDESSYINEFNNLSEQELTNDLLKQVYRNAEIANEKYNYIKWSMRQSFVSLPLWLISVWFLYNL